MPLRIVHAADCHLDAPCLSLDARVRARVRAAEREAFTRLFRTTTLFGLPARSGDELQFRTGGPIGNALLLAMLTSGPEVTR